jgi:hypothetical protein
LVNALTGIPASMVVPMATVGRGMFQHHKNIRDYGRDYRDNADLVPRGVLFSLAEDPQPRSKVS